MTTATSFPDLTIFQLLQRAIREHPERPALVSGARTSSYRELGATVERLASGLAGLDVTRGDRVGILLPNWPEFVETYFAIARLGAIIVPLSMRLGSIELEQLLKHSDIKVVIAAARFGEVDYVPLLRSLWPRLPGLETVVLVGDRDESAPVDARIRPYRSLMGEEATLCPAASPAIDTQNDVGLILFTSGTTSTPKGVMLSHRNVVWTAFNENGVLRTTPDDRFLLVVPLAHVFGAVAGILSAVAAAAAMILVDRFKADEVLEVIDRQRASILYGTPTMFVLQLNSPRLPRFDLTSLRTGIIAAAPCPVEVVKDIMTRMHCDIAVSYGLTETSPALTATTFDDPAELRTSTVGKALPGIELTVVDDQRRPIPAGTVGELACRGYAVMKGYHKRARLTAEMVDGDGWLYTGDLASIDQQGYVRIHGRKKDLIKRGGFAIFPADVEDFLHRHPGVQGVAIVGVPSPVLGEISRAYVVPKPNARIDAQELQEFCKGKLADYKIPDQIRFVEALPLTASGKVQKDRLRERPDEEMG
jgi:fatty-acyl-CoA synthase